MLNYLAQVIDNPGLPTTEVPDRFIIETVIPAVALILGATSVIFIIIGGFRYVISAGAPEQIQQAKNTILYACIGLAVALLAVPIVNFVVSSL